MFYEDISERHNLGDSWRIHPRTSGIAACASNTGTRARENNMTLSKQSHDDSSHGQLKFHYIDSLQTAFDGTWYIVLWPANRNWVDLTVSNSNVNVEFSSSAFSYGEM